MKIFVGGAGGFIGGHLVQYLLERQHQVVAVDIKEFSDWHQFHSHTNLRNICNDLRDNHKARITTRDCDEVYNLACNMGGIGFCEENQVDCGLSIEINTSLTKAIIENRPKKVFYSSSACVYNEMKQTEALSPALKESDAWPAQPDL